MDTHAATSNSPFVTHVKLTLSYPRQTHLRSDDDFTPRQAFTKQCKKQGVLTDDEGAASDGGGTGARLFGRAEMEELRAALSVEQLQGLCADPDRRVSSGFPSCVRVRACMCVYACLFVAFPSRSICICRSIPCASVNRCGPVNGACHRAPKDGMGACHRAPKDGMGRVTGRPRMG